MKNYFSELSQDFVKDLFPKRERFFLIHRYIKFCGPEVASTPEKKLAKFEYMIDHFNRKARVYYSPQQHIVIDECIISYKGSIIFILLYLINFF